MTDRKTDEKSPGPSKRSGESSTEEETPGPSKKRRRGKDQVRRRGGRAAQRTLTTVLVDSKKKKKKKKEKKSVCLCSCADRDFRGVQGRGSPLVKKTTLNDDSLVPMIPSGEVRIDTDR